MRFLFLSQAVHVEDQPDFHVSFRNAIGADSYRNIPYKALYNTGGWDAVVKEVLATNEEFRPNVIYFQFFHSTGDSHPAKLLRILKASSNHPLILGSIGDLFDTGFFARLGRPLPPSVIELAAGSDAFFTTSMGHTTDALVRCGAKNIVFVPNAYCPEHFPPAKGSEKEYDVLMLGSIPKFLSRHPVVSVPTALRRRYVVCQLSRAFGDKFAIFGKGWKISSAHGPVPFKCQVDVFRRSRIVVDSPPRVAETLYSSDRAYFIAGSGSSLVMPYTPKFEMLFKPDENAYFVYRLRDAVGICRKVLSLPPDVRAERERKTYDYIHSRNHIAQRVDTILSVVEALQKHRDEGVRCEEALNHLRLWHFRPELSREMIMPHAVANWKG